MSTPYSIVCSHCGEEITIPYERVARHVHSEHGRRSAAKRPELRDPEYMRNLSKKGWSKRRMHPKHKAILDLAAQEDLQRLSFREIAQKIGLTGKNSDKYISTYMDRLRTKGLLDIPSRADLLKQKEVLALAQREDISTLSAKEVAEKLGYMYPSAESDVVYQIKHLHNKGLLPTKPKQATDTTT